MEKEYILVESRKLAEIKYEALQKLAANKRNVFKRYRKLRPNI